jgi:hypothetical protein
VALIAPGTMFGDRLNQVDLRFSKLLKMSGARKLRFNADVYNALNVSPIIAYNNSYGPNWLGPTQILAGRFLKVGGQLDF